MLMESFKAFSFDWFRTSYIFSAGRGLYNTLWACRQGMKLIKDVYTRRITSREKYNDFLETALEELEKEGSSVNEDVVREHEAILANREDKEGGVTWEEFRHKMTFTNMIFLVPTGYRYTIPAGWIVMVIPSVVHFDPEIYDNPFEFNPWRWEGKELRSGSKTFMVFGAGARQCAGSEYARLQISLFIHHLVTTYDFSLSKDCEVIRVPGALFPNDISMNISKRSK
uniref:Cytochrome P450 n=1 Tax=Brassica oleracea var. oleracea TaxID=109376 RepID=A0A0D3AZT8_BRAOL